ncbi:phosphopantothenate--cysteine ligase 2-like isoform X1 [Haematococcus lacustris]|uniref:Phosphopantothenate--cysteine ligase 2-like isoform X1 n=1 Tax=Haematococcus lacustris TaxID=44745 RepID=A0A699YR37_HAELA|nr:phosphopantothenate--cysteine ligase 2-like isoform X1 [Haematococcus lacustris]
MPFTYRPPATAAAAQCLRSVALALAPCGAQVLFYLAAAVSDFYLPWAELAEHKIQSSEGGLDLQLRKLAHCQGQAGAGWLQVPKMLGLLTRQWCPAAMVVSFKLETDTHILVAKR